MLNESSIDPNPPYTPTVGASNEDKDGKILLISINQELQRLK